MKRGACGVRRTLRGKDKVAETKENVRLGAAFGAWSATATTTEEFTTALAAAQERVGLRLIHMKIEIEQLAASGATISGLRAKS